MDKQQLLEKIKTNRSWHRQLISQTIKLKDKGLRDKRSIMLLNIAMMRLRQRNAVRVCCNELRRVHHVDHE